MTQPASLIINFAYEVPTSHWQQAADGTLMRLESRRPASYEIFDIRNNTRRSETFDEVEAIRVRVGAWHNQGYPGVTSITRRLLEHWHERAARPYPFYFCQLEAMETLIWWVEASAQFRQGIVLRGDGGSWERICNKMATGSDKTTLMGMIIAWQVLNALTYPKRSQDRCGATSRTSWSVCATGARWCWRSRGRIRHRIRPSAQRSNHGYEPSMPRAVSECGQRRWRISLRRFRISSRTPDPSSGHVSSGFLDSSRT